MGACCSKPEASKPKPAEHTETGKGKSEPTHHSPGVSNPVSQGKGSPKFKRVDNKEEDEEAAPPPPSPPPPPPEPTPSLLIPEQQNEEEDTKPVKRKHSDEPAIVIQEGSNGFPMIGVIPPTPVHLDMSLSWKSVWLGKGYDSLSEEARVLIDALNAVRQDPFAAIPLVRMIGPMKGVSDEACLAVVKDLETKPHRDVLPVSATLSGRSTGRISPRTPETVRIKAPLVNGEVALAELLLYTETRESLLSDEYTGIGLRTDDEGCTVLGLAEEYSDDEADGNTDQDLKNMFIEEINILRDDPLLFFEVITSTAPPERFTPETGILKRSDCFGQWWGSFEQDMIDAKSYLAGVEKGRVRRSSLAQDEHVFESFEGKNVRDLLCFGILKKQIGMKRLIESCTDLDSISISRDELLDSNTELRRRWVIKWKGPGNDEGAACSSVLDLLKEINMLRSFSPASYHGFVSLFAAHDEVAAPLVESYPAKQYPVFALGQVRPVTSPIFLPLRSSIQKTLCGALCREPRLLDLLLSETRREIYITKVDCGYEVA